LRSGVLPQLNVADSLSQALPIRRGEERVSHDGPAEAGVERRNAPVNAGGQSKVGSPAPDGKLHSGEEASHHGDLATGRVALGTLRDRCGRLGCSGRRCVRSSLRRCRCSASGPGCWRARRLRVPCRRRGGSHSRARGCRRSSRSGVGRRRRVGSVGIRVCRGAEPRLPAAGSGAPERRQPSAPSVRRLGCIARLGWGVRGVKAPRAARGVRAASAGLARLGRARGLPAKRRRRVGLRR